MEMKCINVKLSENDDEKIMVDERQVQPCSNLCFENFGDQTRSSAFLVVSVPEHETGELQFMIYWVFRTVSHFFTKTVLNSIADLCNVASRGICD